MRQSTAGELRGLLLAAVAFSLAALVPAAAGFEAFNVSYDHRALILGGRRRMLISAGFHYPRAAAEMWPDLIAKCKEGGADVIQTYVFWGGHEPAKGQYNFEGRYDLVKFVKLVASANLYLHLRIGPYVCAEWNFGGFPVWLRDIPGIEFRTDNAPFKEEMQRFVQKIVEMMKEEKLFSWQGGPIILLQIENEYGNIEGKFGQGGKTYVQWAAHMALGLAAGVPWLMCKQPDAPKTIIDACNGFYCDGYKPNSYEKPVIWTEDWNGWYANWGDSLPYRPVRDNAFAVARFFQRGGSFHNYYMFFGGTNFARTAGGPLQSTSYDYDAPIDEYGILSNPKWGHLKDLHAALKLCERSLTHVNVAPQYVKLGQRQEAHIYASRWVNTSKIIPDDLHICSLFLANIDEYNWISVSIFGRIYSLPPWSVSILPDCKNVAFNTAKVGAQVSIKSIESGSPSYSNSSIIGNLVLHNSDVYTTNNWSIIDEPIGAWGDNIFKADGILEHLNVTKDTSDYLWYITRIYASNDDVTYWTTKGDLPLLQIGEIRDVLHIFLNGKPVATKVGHWVSVQQPLQLLPGQNELALLTETVGLQNYGAFLEKDGAGFRGRVTLSGLMNGDIDLSTAVWTYQVGLKGEHLAYYAPDKQTTVGWTDLGTNNVPSPFTWYKTTFDAPESPDPVAIYLGSMGKGQAWVNGHMIGRYWSRLAPKSGCSRSCSYRGTYSDSKCRKNCGKPTQSWYHIPRSWLMPSNNLLVLFEETGGNPLEIHLSLHYTKTVCAKVSENHYPPLTAWSLLDSSLGNPSFSNVEPEVHLQCDSGHVISRVSYASYGNSTGTCQKFVTGKCHAPNSLSLVKKACEGKTECRIGVSNAVFGDPCRGVEKNLAVQAECSSATNNRGVANE